ncbi:MAG: rRNA maturation RNase YbeY [Helicobacteraceae bacterium]|nr:rRNA maturation RNase YbeY [Helicobacteraceae bacterium]
MIELDNRVEFLPDLTLIEEIATSFSDRLIELIITNNKEIQVINKEHRGIDKETDVLSFPYEDSPMSPLGSIVISYEFIKSGSNEFKHSAQDEFTLLFIHGLLHILGYDHEVDNGEMRKKEEELIKNYSLPKSLIIRNSI